MSETVMVEIYTGLGSQRRKIWEGEVATLPRVGERVVIDEDGDYGYTVEYVHHWLATAKVELFVR